MQPAGTQQPEEGPTRGSLPCDLPVTQGPLWAQEAPRTPRRAFQHQVMEPTRGPHSRGGEDGALRASWLSGASQQHGRSPRKDASSRRGGLARAVSAVQVAGARDRAFDAWRNTEMPHFRWSVQRWRSKDLFLIL